MRSSWLYFATRSERESDPVLICSAFVPTAMSAMVVSSVSPGAVRDHRGVARALGELDRGEGLGQRADLVDLDQDRVRHAQLDALLEQPRVGDEEVVADELHPLAERLREALPAVPVGFGHPVLDAHDREAVGERLRDSRRTPSPRARASPTPAGTCRARRTPSSRSRARAPRRRPACSRPPRSPR